MKNQKPRLSLWRKADTLRMIRLILIGTGFGVTVRWLNFAAPPLPVMAATHALAETTNTPKPAKIEGASPLARD